MVTDAARLTEHMAWRFGAGSDVGRIRTQNEDAYGADEPKGLFVVADGMGGHAAGEVASGLAVRCATEGLAVFPPASLEEARDRLREAIADANQVILIEGQADPDRSGMGTTTTALLLSPDGWWMVGHVGDSRAYLVRDGVPSQITEDHTYVQELVNQGRISDEEARLHPRSSLLTRALGTGAQVSIDMFEGELRAGDRFVLASDGLMSMLPEDVIRELISDSECAADELVTRLIDAANEAGGHDNVTVLVVDAVTESEGDDATA